jgi:hypothetical protein
MMPFKGYIIWEGFKQVIFDFNDCEIQFEHRCQFFTD